MSKIATFDQGAHTLKLIGDQEPTGKQVVTLHEYLPVLMRGIVSGTVPPLADFSKLVGIPSVVPKRAAGDTPFLCELTSDGRSPGQLILDIRAKGRTVWDWAENVMTKGKDKFPAVTTGVKYRLGVIFGCEFEDAERTNENIFAEIERRKVQKPHAEVAPLLRDTFTQAELLKMVNALRPEGSTEITWVIVMHEPIRASDGYPYILGLDRSRGDGDLDADDGSPGVGWYRGSAFVVLLPQAQA
ncbi:MAG TPA: hypothetical protein VJJ47_03790 [Candidatus Paceibacterota bacterium]